MNDEELGIFFAGVTIGMIIEFGILLLVNGT